MNFGISIENNECMTCELIEKGGKRYPGCQDHCPVGKALKAERDKIREERRKARMADSLQRDVFYRSVERYQRSTNYKRNK